MRIISGNFIVSLTPYYALLIIINAFGCAPFSRKYVGVANKRFTGLITTSACIVIIFIVYVKVYTYERESEGGREVVREGDRGKGRKGMR